MPAGERAGPLSPATLRRLQLAALQVRLHTSAYVSIRQHTYATLRRLQLAALQVRLHTSAYVCIRQHTSAYEVSVCVCVCV